MSPRILHLEPDQQYATELGLRLMFMGMESAHTTDPIEAITLILYDSVDVLICEMELNAPAGIHFIAGIKKMKPSLHILVISKRGEPELMEAGFTAGAEAYLVKGLTDTHDNIMEVFNHPSIARLFKVRKL